MKILVAYDGSRQADNALADLSMAGLPEKAEAIVISVAEPWAQHFGSVTDPLFGGLSPVLITDASAFDEQVRKGAAVFCNQGIQAIAKRFPLWKISGFTAEGSPAVEILDKSKSWNPDLMVMGAHGRSLLGRVFLGSVSQRVLHYANTSVRITHGNPAAKVHAPRILVAFDGSTDAAYGVEVIASRKWPKGTTVRLVAVFDCSIERLFIGSVSSGVAAQAKCTVEIVRRPEIRKIQRAAKTGFQAKQEKKRAGR